MALLNYAGKDSYLRIDGLEIKNTETKTIIINLSLYANSSKNQKIWSTNLQYIAKPAFRGNSKCETVQSLNADLLLPSPSENIYAFYKNKLYRKTENGFEEEVGLPGEVILNTTDGQWYVLSENGIWNLAGLDIFTEGVYEKFFSVQALDMANPYKKAYEFLLTQPQFSHCTADE